MPTPGYNAATMSTARPEIRVRHAVPADAAALCDILNAIIMAGGTTAMEVPLSLVAFTGYFLGGERFLACFVAGTALFARSKIWAGERDVVAINAAIRADNQSGLAYYEKMGFRNYQIVKGVPLRDGTPVDRIFKCHAMKRSRS
jgi:putative intracellular protease/amidase